MQISSDRQPIPDVAAVYFVEPTEEVVSRIVEDATRGVYDAFYLNFSSHISREMMEKLATGLVEGNAAGRVVQVFDQFTRFVSLDDGMFSLGLPNTYFELNDPKSNDIIIEGSIARIVEGIFCALATSGVVPIICSRLGVLLSMWHVLWTKRYELRSNIEQTSSWKLQVPRLVVDLSGPCSACLTGILNSV
jgi:hypothetical protein